MLIMVIIIIIKFLWILNVSSSRLRPFSTVWPPSLAVTWDSERPSPMPLLNGTRFNNQSAWWNQKIISWNYGITSVPKKNRIYYVEYMHYIVYSENRGGALKRDRSQIIRKVFEVQLIHTLSTLCNCLWSHFIPPFHRRWSQDVLMKLHISRRNESGTFLWRPSPSRPCWRSTRTSSTTSTRRWSWPSRNQSESQPLPTSCKWSRLPLLTGSTSLVWWWNPSKDFPNSSFCSRTFSRYIPCNGHW